MARKVCASFVNLCQQIGLLAKASVAIDVSKFKAVNNRDCNFTRGKIDRRRQQQSATWAISETRLEMRCRYVSKGASRESPLLFSVIRPPASPIVKSSQA
jgi:hypothetical protein